MPRKILTAIKEDAEERSYTNFRSKTKGLHQQVKNQQTYLSISYRGDKQRKKSTPEEEKLLGHGAVTLSMLGVIIFLSIQFLYKKKIKIKI
jgi:hypothetical protein